MSTDAGANNSAVQDAVAKLIVAADGGDDTAPGKLFVELYRELHRVAKRQLRIGAPNSTLSATTLLHECYLSMAAGATVFPDQSRFIAYAARAMRGLIVDHIRDQKALKRGGEFHLTTLNTHIEDSAPLAGEVAGLSDALEQLEQADPQLAKLIDLKYFCGFSFTDIAKLRGVSERTVGRDWQKARLYLHHALVAD
jgi:RNA polymerase sigma factor (TIGR02999 family)